MNKKSIYKGILLVLALLLLGSVVFVWQLNRKVKVIGATFLADENSTAQAALVLGARVYGDGRLSDVFRDRVDTALALYEAGRVKKILLSGDHGQVDYDEVNTAKAYLLERGVLAADIFLDHAGFDTYDSLYRAREVFAAESLLVVTQEFHLPRAVYLAQKLGLSAWGVPADKHVYRQIDAMRRREYLATVKAWFDANFDSGPKFLGPVIDLAGDGRLSWD